MKNPTTRSANRWGVLAAVLAATLLVGACGSPGKHGGGSGNGGAGASSSTVSVVASTNVWGNLVETIGGSDVRVTSIISDPAQDPHSYQANTHTLLAISKADVVVENGGGYDDFMNAMIKSSKTHASVLNAVDISGKTPAHGEQLNEHVWYDLPTVKKVADAIAVALGKAQPDNTNYFRPRAENLDAKINTLIAQESALKHQFDGRRIGITEPVPLYLTTACGLSNATPPGFSEAVEEGDDVSPAVLKQTLDLYTHHTVDALVYNEQTSGPVTEQVKAAAQKSGTPIVPVTETLPPGLDYLGWMRQNLAHLKTALDHR